MRSWLAVAFVFAACDAGPLPPKPEPKPVVVAAPPLTQWRVSQEEPVRAPTANDLATYERDIGGNGALTATIETTLGTLHCTLLPDRAPLAVANFVGLATGKKPWLDPKTHEVRRGRPFYDGLTFHRVIPEFMIQGGDPLANGTAGPGYTFANEIDEHATMGPGALAMANAGPGVNGSGTNGSQFFIMEGGSRPDLVQHHTIFGQCTELAVVKQIARVPRNTFDKPETPVTIKHISFRRQ